MRKFCAIVVLMAVLFTSCGPSNEDLTDAISEHMVRVGMAQGNDYHALKIDLVKRGEEKDKAIDVVAAISGGISPAGTEQGTVVPSPFSDTLHLTLAEVDGRWEVRGPTEK